MTRLYLYLALGAAALAALAYAVRELRQSGIEAERARQVQENNNAVKNADKYGTTFRDCLERGGVYNYANGKCVGGRFDNR